MKSKFARVFLLFLILLFCISSFGLSAFAEQKEHYCSICPETDTMYAHFKCNICGCYLVLGDDGFREVSVEEITKPSAIPAVPSQAPVATPVPEATTAPASQPASTTCYDYSGAINWALTNCFVNPNSSCSAFICDALYSGGKLPYMPRYDHVGEMVLTILAQGYGSLYNITETTVNWIQPGDIILVHDPATFDGNYYYYGSHCIFVTGIDYSTGTIYYCQHNPTYSTKAVYFSSLYNGNYAHFWSPTAQVQFIHMYK